MSDEEIKLPPTPIEHAHTIRYRRAMKDMQIKLSQAFGVPIRYIGDASFGYGYEDRYACTCVFKDKQCCYIGPETWCDKTAQRCIALDNLINYRGGPRMPAP